MPSIGDNAAKNMVQAVQLVAFLFDMTSRMFSTTQTTDSSREGLLHIVQVSVSDILWHVLQRLTFFSQ